MPFGTGDQERIADALKLGPEQYRADSELAKLMTEAEANDTTHSTNLVDKITVALDILDTLDTSISTKASQDGLSSVSVSNQFSKSFRSGGAATAHLKADRQSQIDLIKRLLDPYMILEQFSQGGRVVRTL